MALAPLAENATRTNRPPRGVKETHMLTESLRAVVNEALAPYGASLGDGDVICSIKKPTGIRVDAKKGKA